jgi:cytochrome c553
LRERTDRKTRLFGKPRQQRASRWIGQRGKGAIKRGFAKLNHVVKYRKASGAVKRPLYSDRMRSAVRVLILGCAMLAPAFGQSIEDKAQICTACHGESGIPVGQAGPAPVIWGQNPGYLFLQLRDFKSGARKSEQMAPIVENFEAGELMQLAWHFAKKNWPNLQQLRPPPAVVAVAERVNVAVSCAACHQRDFSGDNNQPRLAGQSRAYLEKTMLDFRSSARGNNAGMHDLMLGVTEDEIGALAAYLAGR